ncbi:Lrp/AsnC family transcriptional regulator [Kribbella endophytica]
MLDELDRGVLHALRIDGRAPYSRIGAVLGVSTQTVARRFRRLVSEAGLRVVGLADPHRAGQAQWLARLTAAPQAAQDLARALARRDDTSWVRLASGGTEIVAVINTKPDAGNTLLLHDIPRTAGITGVSAHYLLHMYRGGPTAWPAHTKALTLDQQQQLAVDDPSAQAAGVGPADRELLAVLGRDGRASYAELAVATGWSAATVARRVGELQASGAIYFDVDLDPVQFGVTTGALLWMSVAPAHLDKVAGALAEHEELAFVAATTGRTNLAAHALSPGPDALHRYLTQRLAAFPEITTLESAPVLRTVKSAAPFLPGLRTRPGVS